MSFNYNKKYSYRSIIVLSACIFVAILFMSFAILFWDHRLYSLSFFELLPSFYNWFIFGICLLVASMIVSPLGRFLIVIWSAWFVVGTLNMISGQYIGRLLGNVDVEFANTLFLSGVLAFGLGVVFWEKMALYRRILPPNTSQFSDIRKLSFLSLAIVYSFPFIYLISFYSTLGEIPMFSGRDIVRDIYLLDYGPIYRLKLVLLIVLVLLAFKIKTQFLKINNIKYTIGIIACLLIAVIDGKRYIAIAFLLSFIGLVSLMGEGRIFTKKTALFTFLAILISSSVVLIRSNTETNSIYYYFNLMGDEYKEYVYSINNFGRGEVDSYGYDWVKSTIGSGINRHVLSVFGVVKSGWVNLDSARSWQKIYNSDYGIRTGLLSELWYAFEYAAFAILFLFGVSLSWLTWKIRNSKTELGFICLMSVYGLSILAIMGQSTTLVGGITTIIYFWCFIGFIELFASPRVADRKYSFPLPYKGTSKNTILTEK